METWIFTIIYGLIASSVTPANASNIFITFTAAKPLDQKCIALKMVKLFRKAVKVI
jgi:hypothetical protein